jgi:hypothetical protein
MSDKVRVTKDQLKMLQQVSDYIGTGSRTTSELFQEVGRRFVKRRAGGARTDRSGRLIANGPLPRFAQMLHRLGRRGLLVKVGRGSPYQGAQWRMGPLSDLLKEQGKLLERAGPH